MHILYFQQILHLPGEFGTSRSFEFARKWVALGNKVSLICSSAYLSETSIGYTTSSEVQHFHLEGIEIYVIPEPYSHLMNSYQRVIAFFRFLWKAYQFAIKLEGIDLVIAYSPPLTVGELGRRVSRLKEVPLALEVADVWPDVPIQMGVIKNKLLVWGLRKFAGRIYRSANLILSFSEDMEKQLSSYGLESVKIHPVLNGPNLVPSSNLPTKTPEVITCLYAGTIGRANDLGQLIEIACRIQESGREHIQFVVVGEGNRLEQVKEVANSRRCRNVSFVPRVSKTDLHQYFIQADIGIGCFAAYPVLEANGSAKWFDYLAYGLPVVINHRGWQARFLEQHHCGLSSDMGDLTQWMDNILLLVDNRELREEMGQNGKRIIDYHYLREDLAEQSLQYLKEMITSSNL